MRPLRKIASELLGFDRRERRATYTLAVILALLLLLRAFIPGKRDGGERIVIPQAAVTPLPAANRGGEVKLFRFDPNTATAETLVQLGFSERQAATLINYRNAGARFRKPSDIFRVYGIDTVFAARLVPWIGISPVETRGAAEGRTPEAGSWSHRSGRMSTEATKKNPGTGSTRQAAHMSSADSDLKSPGKSVAVIDLNRCSAEDLLKLPGIGEVLSARIVKYRDLLGGYVSVAQLSEVYGLDSSAVENISGRVKVSGEVIRVISLDTCSWGQMARHPYLGPEAARAIMKYRSLVGGGFDVDDLVLQRVISSEQAARIAPYVVSSGRGSDSRL
jgi:DNA uptake protein ComE-like DNA-binding protein